jgi:uncharacterized membrane protein
MKIIFHFLLTLAAYIVLDMAFINFFAKDFIQKQVGFLLTAKPNLLAAGIFYLIFISGILYFCVYPAIEIKSAPKALFNGAFFGLVTYATYELVNLSLIDKWSVRLVIVDMVWGITVGAIVSWVGFKLHDLFF